MQTTAIHPHPSPSIPMQSINPKSNQNGALVAATQGFAFLLSNSLTLTRCGDEFWWPRLVGLIFLGWVETTNQKSNFDFWHLLADLSCPILNAVRMSGTTEVLGWQWGCGWRHIVPLQHLWEMREIQDWFQRFPSFSSFSNWTDMDTTRIHSGRAQSFPWHPVKRPWCKDLHCLSWCGPRWFVAGNHRTKVGPKWLKSIRELWQDRNTS